MSFSRSLPIPTALDLSGLDPSALATAAMPHEPVEAATRLDKMAREGPVRRTTLELWSAVRADRANSELTIHNGLRRSVRLGSRDRRVASAVLYAFIRYESVLDVLLTEHGLSPDDDIARYLLAMVLVLGLDPETVPGEFPGERLPSSDLCLARVAAYAASLEPTRALALGGSLPEWLAKAWIELLGAESAELIRAFSARPPMAARANVHRISRQALMERLSAEGVTTRPGEHAADAVIFEQRRNIQVLQSFREGLYEVQDEGSQLIVDLLDPRPGQRVLDYCAGAGGKSLAMASRGAEVRALDVRADALQTLERRAQRAGLRVRTQLLDERGTPNLDPRWADAVLVDAPCTGSGVLRRHPENRYRLNLDRLHRISREQALILERAAGFVRPGARLVYATCSLLPGENQEIVNRFMEHHPDWEIEALLGQELACARGDEAGVLWPHRTGTDGFFGVCLTRGG